jgi:hypothetical protein
LDLIGTAMGIATIPMALLTIVSLFAGIALLSMGFWHPVLWGALAFMLCTALAPALEQIVVQIDDAAARALARQERLTGQVIAILSGGLPVAVLLAWEFAVFHFIMAGASSKVTTLLLWLWSYGVATGPWTLLVLRVSRFRRTLCGVRAYAGHSSYWLLSLLTLETSVSPSTAAASMLFPAILPFVLGFLLALADRDALSNVRV